MRGAGGASAARGQRQVAGRCPLRACPALACPPQLHPTPQDAGQHVVRPLASQPVPRSWSQQVGAPGYFIAAYCSRRGTGNTISSRWPVVMSVGRHGSGQKLDKKDVTLTLWVCDTFFTVFTIKTLQSNLFVALRRRWQHGNTKQFRWLYKRLSLCYRQLVGH